MKDAIDNLNKVASDMGGQFDDNIRAQVMMNNELERVLGHFQKGSFQGVGEAATEIGTKAALNRLGVAGKVIDVTRENVKFTPPSKEKLELLKKLRTYFKE